MKKKDGWQLTEGSLYLITSIGAKDNSLETEGIFKGFASLGLDEIGICIEQTKNRKGKLRVIPIHAILAIDVISEKEKEKEEENVNQANYYS